MPKYPNECCRCGMCCLSETCPAGQDIYQVERRAKCPGLTFEENKAVCAVLNILADWNIPGEDAKKIMGIGAGCCIKARAYISLTPFDFADLPASTKIGLVTRLRGEAKR